MTPYSSASLAPLSDELLSAYLDGQVTAEERLRVEAALTQDAAVQTRLAALAMTVELMQRLPQVSSPRSFVLSETQVLAAGGRVQGMVRPGFWARLLAGAPRMMPLATAAVAFLLIVTLGVDFWPRPALAPAPSMEQELAVTMAEPPAVKMAPEAASETAPATAQTEEVLRVAPTAAAPQRALSEAAPMVPPSETPPPADLTAGGMGGGETAMEPSLNALAVPTDTAALSASATEISALSAITSEITALAVAETPTTASAAELAVAAAPVDAETPAAAPPGLTDAPAPASETAIAPEEASAEVIAAAETAPVLTEDTQLAPSPLRIFEYTLLALLILLAAATMWVRRRA